MIVPEFGDCARWLRKSGQSGDRRSQGLGGNFAALGQGGDAVGGTVGQGLDGHGGLAAARGYEAAAVAEEKILDVVRAMVGVDDRRFWISAHAAGAEQVDCELLLLNRRAPPGFGAGGVEDFESAGLHPLHHFQIVWMIAEGHAQRGKAIGIFHVGIERKAVGLNGERSAMAENLERAREIVREGLLEAGAPFWSTGRQSV